MKTLFTILAAAIAVAAPAAAQTGAQPKPRAVIELFTSQGCSSCPPADKLMTELSRDPNLIVLTLPVDYWDYLGWKDTLAHAAFTQRQRAYSAVRGDRQVYTPQAVINGASHAVGSEKSAIDQAIISTKLQPGVLSVPVAIEKGDLGLTVNIAQSAGFSGHVWVLSTVRERSVQIGRGENTGRNMTYTNVVRSLTRIGPWSGEAASIEIPKSAIAEDAEGVVVLVQTGSEKKPGQIIGAARRVLGL
ncbi:MAG: DUF1223 domain-containing protein [Methylocystis sp.]|nr:DUF1223 domain-containing protein [Methylocystis sp.]MCA3587427.1 DUF1223 domain-containing protein [Methylocystis sp.]MCA3592760.1 DUF1223 domain-containing protein [Methylocystis sp.]